MDGRADLGLVHLLSFDVQVGLGIENMITGGIHCVNSLYNQEKGHITQNNAIDEIR
jgi:hypothetical protein